MQTSVFASAALALLLAAPAVAQSVARPQNWNWMNAAQQASWLCQHDRTRAVSPCLETVEPARRSYKNLPANWNWMNADEQARWLNGGVVAPRVRPFAPLQSPGVRCGRACGEPWTAADFEASRRELERLERDIADQSRLNRPVYVPADRPSLNFYNNSRGVTGSSVSLPPFEFYNFSNGVSGTATTLPPFTFYDFTNSRGKTTTGTSTTIGQFDFHNFSNGVSGTSTTIGGTTFHNFSNGKTCTTQTIGASTFTNCY
jgi:hypothetical protein